MTLATGRLIAATIGIAGIPLLGIAIVRLLLPIEVSYLTRDVAAIAHIHPLTGALSSLGILLWWTSATVWLFTALVRRGRPGAAGTGFLVYSGLLSAYLGLDDLFQFHEFLAQEYLGVPERVVFGLLAMATATYVWRYRRLLVTADGAPLLLALGLLSFSVVADDVVAVFLSAIDDWQYLIEDGAKWLGIALWTAFAVVWCSTDLRSTWPIVPAGEQPGDASHASKEDGSMSDRDLPPGMST